MGVGRARGELGGENSYKEQRDTSDLDREILPTIIQV